MTPLFFANGREFRRWLEQHHASTVEAFIGFYKKGASRDGMTYAEAIDEALCFGWIDGVIRRLDEESYMHRFTPRRKGSTWSLVNIEKVKRLLDSGRMHAAGIAAFEARTAHNCGIYLYERIKAQPDFDFSAGLLRQLRADKKAWKIWNEQPPGYRKTATRWVMTAKQEATRGRRFKELLRLTRAGTRLGMK